MIHLTTALKCKADVQVRVFFLLTYPQVFDYIPVNVILGCFMKLLSYILSITWSHRDVFIMNIAIALTFRFRQYNEMLLTHKDRSMSADFWWQSRWHYRKLCSLVQEADDLISSLMLLALIENVFFICVHLLNSI